MQKTFCCVEKKKKKKKKKKKIARNNSLPISPANSATDRSDLRPPPGMIQGECESPRASLQYDPARKTELCVGCAVSSPQYCWEEEKKN
jgi:hypothetical protein